MAAILNNPRFMTFHGCVQKMAYCNFSLPALKLTKHKQAGSKSVSYLPRELPRNPTTLQSQDQLQAMVTSSMDGCSGMNETAPLEDATAYELEVKAAISGWEQIRRQMLDAVVEGVGM